MEIYERVYDVKVGLAGFITNSDFPQCGFSPDAYLYDRSIQVKCFKKEKHLLCSKGVDPLIFFEVVAQLQFEMMILDVQFNDLVLYNPDCNPEEAFKVLTVERDESIIKRFKERLNE